ncbi:hypothetical protein LTR84_012661 [Exophiala bonariae]|uniref:Glutathione S-transferase kappa 1 n=1 Tax=Exophiala bonariae TaxID=1690606 RepID=A0AAV9NFV8_9EURO|nr:hypothetical protein LTR84_012661 [Exophiala bonariae]
MGCTTKTGIKNPNEHNGGNRTPWSVTLSLTLTHLLRIHPVFLGGINVGSGNKPPWTLPAKAKYGTYDSKRAVKYFGTEQLVTPDFFPILSVVPQRAMLVVKDRHPREVFENCFLDTWRCSFVTHVNIEKPEGLAKLLGAHFDENEVKEIMRLMTTKEYKDRLTQNTKDALEQGAFGAPWFKLTNAQGVVEPLFGSDRWAYMWDFLGVDFEDIKIVDKTKGKAKL